MLDPNRPIAPYQSQHHYLIGGGVAPFNSKSYHTGDFKGENVFGDTATRYRDAKLRELEENHMI